jgi:hypothetical protein
MRTLAYTKNGNVAVFADANAKQGVGIYRHATINNAHMADWAAEAALHHHGAVSYTVGEYPACFASFFNCWPDVTYSSLEGGYIYSWQAEGVSILIQD